MRTVHACAYTVLLLSAASYTEFAEAQPTPPPPPASASANTVLVTVDNFIRAESDKALASTVKLDGSASSTTLASCRRLIGKSSRARTAIRCIHSR